MRSLDYNELIKESAAELRLLQRKVQRSVSLRRLAFLWLLKTGRCSSQAAAGAQIGIKLRASEKLWKRYAAEGITALLRPHGGGRPPKLSEAARNALQTELDGSRVATLKQACQFVAQNHSIRISRVAMHYYFKQQKIKKKTGRSSNIRKDEPGAEAFKKKSFPS